MASQNAVHSNKVSAAIGILVHQGESFWHDYFSLEIDSPCDHEQAKLVDEKRLHGVSNANAHPLTAIEVDSPSKSGKLLDAVHVPDLIADVANCEPVTPGRRPKDPSKSEPSCFSVSAISAFVMAIVCVSIVLGRDYVKYVLLSLESSNVAVSFFTFALLFTAVSFPVAWGYILLNIAAGYLYGLVGGLALVVSCATCGIITAHLVIKRFLSEFVRSRLLSASMGTIVGVVESEHGFKMIVLSRLTPIPFGLQNALFAMSNISLQRYVLASVTGMLPCQGLHAYVGSTLRSMEEVVSSGSSSSTAYFVFGGQLLMIIALFIFVVRKARMEFNKTVQQAEDDYLVSPAVVESVKSYSKSAPLGYGVVPDCSTSGMAVL